MTAGLKRKLPDTCPDCNQGLDTYEINLNESVVMCVNRECAYPFNQPRVEEFIFETSSNDTGYSNHKKLKTQSSSSVANSTIKASDVDNTSVEKSAKESSTDIMTVSSSLKKQKELLPKPITNSTAGQAINSESFVNNCDPTIALLLNYFSHIAQAPVASKPIAAQTPTYIAQPASPAPKSAINAQSPKNIVAPSPATKYTTAHSSTYIALPSSPARKSVVAPLPSNIVLPSSPTRKAIAVPLLTNIALPPSSASKATVVETPKNIALPPVSAAKSTVANPKIALPSPSAAKSTAFQLPSSIATPSSVPVAAAESSESFDSNYSLADIESLLSIDTSASILSDNSITNLLSNDTTTTTAIDTALASYSQQEFTLDCLSPSSSTINTPKDNSAISWMDDLDSLFGADMAQSKFDPLQGDNEFDSFLGI